MNKKVFITSAVLATCLGVVPDAIIPVQNAQAASTEPRYSVEGLKSQTSWTIDELKFFSEFAEQELEDYCKDAEDSWDCQMSHSFERQEESAIYGAVEIFDMQKILITSINPDNQTIKVIYKDKIGGFERMMGMGERRDIDSLYIARFDKGYTTYDFYRSVQAYDDDTGSHAVFAGESSKLGVGWLTPGIETELAVTNLSDDPSIDNILHYAVTDAGNSTNLSSYDYASCLESSEYQPGYDCRLIYSGDWWKYVPVDPNFKESAEDDVDDNIEQIEDKSSEEQDDSNSYIEFVEENKNLDTILVVKNSQNDAKSQAEDIALAPADTASQSPIIEAAAISRTGYVAITEVSESNDTSTIPEEASQLNTVNLQDAKDCNCDNLNVPNLGIDRKKPIAWWVFLTIIIGITALLIWWFLPIKKRRTSSTNRK